MKEPMAQKRKTGSSDKLGKEDLTGRKDFAAKPESRPLADLPHRTSAETPSWDMLARVEGIARWGLNE
jgi:hypothetical protein